MRFWYNKISLAYNLIFEVTFRGIPLQNMEKVTSLTSMLYGICFTVAITEGLQQHVLQIN